MFNPAIVVMLLSIALFGTSAVAASFDCAKASTYPEKAICKSSELSYLDQDMAAHYKVALSTTPNPEQLKDQQRNWLAVRDNCGDEACLQTNMEARIFALQAIYESNTAPRQTAEPEPADAVTSSNQIAPPPASATPAATGIALASQVGQEFAKAAEAAKQQAEESVSVTSNTTEVPANGQPKAEQSYLPLKIAGVVLALIA